MKKNRLKCSVRLQKVNLGAPAEREGGKVFSPPREACGGRRPLCEALGAPLPTVPQSSWPSKKVVWAMHGYTEWTTGQPWCLTFRAPPKLITRWMLVLSARPQISCPFHSPFLSILTPFCGLLSVLSDWYKILVDSPGGRKHGSCEEGEEGERATGARNRGFEELAGGEEGVRPRSSDVETRPREGAPPASCEPTQGTPPVTERGGSFTEEETEAQKGSCKWLFAQDTQFRLN